MDGGGGGANLILTELYSEQWVCLLSYNPSSLSILGPSRRTKVETALLILSKMTAYVQRTSEKSSDKIFGRVNRQPIHI